MIVVSSGIGAFKVRRAKRQPQFPPKVMAIPLQTEYESPWNDFAGHYNKLGRVFIPQPGNLIPNPAILDALIDQCATDIELVLAPYVSLYCQSCLIGIDVGYV